MFLSFEDKAFQWMKAMSGRGLAPMVARPLTMRNLIIENGRPLLGDLRSNTRLALRFYAGASLVLAPGRTVCTLCVLDRTGAMRRCSI